MQRYRRHRGVVAAALLVVALAGGCGRADRTAPRDTAGRTQPAAATVPGGPVGGPVGGAVGDPGASGAATPPAPARVPPVDEGDLAGVDRELSRIDQDLAGVDDALAADEGDETP